MSITNEDEFNEKTLQPILKRVCEDLGTNSAWDVKTELYKFLLYEPGCFFRLHRDTERIPNMFGTLVIQLPSKYTGATLSVRSPLDSSPEFASVFDMSKKSTTQIHYAAFYNDCLHEVTELEKGERCVLVYSLVGAKAKVPPIMKEKVPPIVKVSHQEASVLQSNRHPSDLPPQPANASVAKSIASVVAEWGAMGEPPADVPAPKPEEFMPEGKVE